MSQINWKYGTSTSRERVCQLEIQTIVMGKGLELGPVGYEGHL